MPEALVALGLKTQKQGNYAPPLAKPWAGWTHALGRR